MTGLQQLKRAALAAAFVLVNTAEAGIIGTFSDQVAFVSATGAQSISGPIPDIGNVGSSATLGSVTFSTTAFSTTTDIFFGGGNFSTLIAGNEIGISGSENLDVSIDVGHQVTAFGVVFHEPSTTDQVTDGTNTPHFHDSTFTLEIRSGTLVIDSVAFTPANDVLTFMGLVSDTGFDNVRITEDLAGVTYGGGIDISNDNEFFGEFFAAPIPEPGPLALLAVGVVALVSGRRALGSG